MKRKANFVLQSVGDDNILVPTGAQVMDMNGLITLNETGAHLWELLSEDRTAAQLSEALTRQFDVDAETADKDIRTFLDHIDEMGLLDR